jgi:hypothetical protein
MNIKLLNKHVVGSPMLFSLSSFVLIMRVTFGDFSTHGTASVLELIVSLKATVHIVDYLRGNVAVQKMMVQRKVPEWLASSIRRRLTSQPKRLRSIEPLILTSIFKIVTINDEKMRLKIELCVES